MVNIYLKKFYPYDPIIWSRYITNYFLAVMGHIFQQQFSWPRSRLCLSSSTKLSRTWSQSGTDFQRRTVPRRALFPRCSCRRENHRRSSGRSGDHPVLSGRDIEIKSKTRVGKLKWIWLVHSAQRLWMKSNLLLMTFTHLFRFYSFISVIRIQLLNNHVYDKHFNSPYRVPWNMRQAEPENGHWVVY